MVTIVTTKASSVARPHALQSLAVAAVIVACGSTRLENAFDPAASRNGSDPVSPASGSAASGGGADRGGSDAGDGGDGGDGVVPPIPQRPIVALTDFPASFTIGPVNAERIDVSGLPFTQAWRATMAEPPTESWTAQLIVPQTKALAKGQLLHVSFWVKCEVPGASGDCQTAFIFERASDPWEKSVAVAARAGSGWTQKSEFFSTLDSYGVGVAHMLFRLGYAAQQIDIGGVEVDAIGSPP